MTREHTDLIGPHGEVVTHKRITRNPGTTTCTGTMQTVLVPDDVGHMVPAGTEFDHIAICSLCGTEYAVQTQAGKAIRDGRERAA